MYNVIGISHSLLDLCAQVDEHFIEENNLDKGHLNLLTESSFKNMVSKLDETQIEIKPGGSVPNTLAGLRLFDVSCCEFGKVGNDKHGDFLIEQNKKLGIGCNLSRGDFPTGTVLCLITPDTERTFAVYLGSSTEVSGDNIDDEIVSESKIIHTTCYEFESPKVRLAIRKCAALAKENDLIISFDLADPGVIQRNFADLVPFLRENANIIFANIDEAKEFTGKNEPIECLGYLSELADYAIVKLGDKGSLIKDKDGKIHKIKAYKAKAVDTTGAGDMYAAGILYGICNGIDMNKAGKIASYAAAKVVRKIGARLDELDISKVR